MADRLTDFVHKCMKHGGVEGSVSFAKPNGYSVLASTDTLTFDVLKCKTTTWLILPTVDEEI